MSDRKDKAFERRVAKRLGGRRIPTTGEKHGIDVDCGWLVVQCKNGYRMPGYLQDWLKGIQKQAKRESDAKEWSRSTTGIVVWRSGGQAMDDDDAIVMMSLKDFVDLHGA